LGVASRDRLPRLGRPPPPLRPRCYTPPPPRKIDGSSYWYPGEEGALLLISSEPAHVSSAPARRAPPLRFVVLGSSGAATVLISGQRSSRGPPAEHVGGDTGRVGWSTRVGLGLVELQVARTSAAGGAGGSGGEQAPRVGPTQVSRVWAHVGTQERVCGAGEKRISFWQKRSLNFDFLVFYSSSALSTSKNI
jgi:hypothetical protein